MLARDNMSDGLFHFLLNGSVSTFAQPAQRGIAIPILKIEWCSILSWQLLMMKNSIDVFFGIFSRRLTSCFFLVLYQPLQAPVCGGKWWHWFCVFFWKSQAGSRTLSSLLPTFAGTFFIILNWLTLLKGEVKCLNFAVLFVYYDFWWWENSTNCNF